MQQKFIAKFNKISFTIITGLCAFLPLFFLPANLGGLEAVKGVVLYVGVFFAFSLWLVAQFLEGTLRVPKHGVLSMLGIWLALALLSAFTSRNVGLSLWGRGFSIDSFTFFLSIGLFTFLVATFVREQRKLIKLFLAAFAGSVITVLLQVVLYSMHGFGFVASHLGHVAIQGTLVGSWVDFAEFVTFTFILSLMMFEVLVPGGFFRFLSLFSIVLCLVTLAFLNFTAAWVVAIASALLVFVYKTSVERSLARTHNDRSYTHEDEEAVEAEVPQQHFPLASFVALLVGLFFFLSSGSVGASLASRAGINFSDIRPSFSTSMHVARASLAHNPIFGAGAGRYADVWNLYHPTAINQTIFWNTPFDSGFSLFVTLLTTSGLLASLALIAMLALSLIHGFKLFSYEFPDRFSRFIAVTSFIMLIAFVGLFFIASPGMVLILIGFMYIGLLVGVSTLVGRTPVASLYYLRDPRTSFFAILTLVLSAMAGFTAVYFSGNRFASIIEYNRAVAASDFSTAQVRLDRAISLSQNDIYWRTRTALFTSQFAKGAQQQNPDKAQLQSYFTQAENSARAAVAWDPNSANNWADLSQVYQLVASDQNNDAYGNAKSAADQAVKLAPGNPAYALNEASVALTKKDTTAALAAIQTALSLKSDYLDAYILKAQIETAGGNTTAAKDELSNYIKAAPFDDQGYILLGRAELQLKEYQAALDAFARAKQLDPTNPNSYLAYINTLEVMGQKDTAIAELQKFKKIFPQITGVDDQINRIQTGAAPSSDTSTASSTAKQ